MKTEGEETKLLLCLLKGGYEKSQKVPQNESQLKERERSDDEDNE